MRLGFVGTGAITAAMVEGLFKVPNRIASVLLSPRNAQIADRLARLDDRVRVAGNNQDVLDGSDVVVLAVRPQVAPMVVPSLRFDARHHVLSVIATVDLAQLSGWTGPVAWLGRAISLPFVAVNKGMTAYYPDDPAASHLFGLLGVVFRPKARPNWTCICPPAG